jgi:hypothetical protein
MLLAWELSRISGLEEWKPSPVGPEAVLVLVLFL